MYDMFSSSISPPPSVGMIGLGTMGGPMARNLLASAAHSGLTITARSREGQTALLDAGASWAVSAREVAAASRVVILMLPDLPEVELVLAGPDGLLAGVTEPTTLVICSTSSASGLRDLAARLAPLITVVDAPVSGGEEGAINGTLSIMVGGEAVDVERVLPVLAPMGTAVHLGPLGSGEIAKYCNQMIVAASILALGEAAVIAERSGLDLRALFDLLEGGYAGSRVLQTRKDRIVSGDYGSSGVAKYMVKDLGFALEEAARTGTVAEQLALLRTQFAALTAAGFGDSDISVTRAFVASKR